MKPVSTLCVDNYGYRKMSNIETFLQKIPVAFIQFENRMFFEVGLFVIKQEIPTNK